MNNGVKIIFAFSLGAVAGATIAWKLLKTKYEKISQEEIDSVKEAFSVKQKDYPTEDEIEELEEENKRRYQKVVENYISKENTEKGGSDSMNIPKYPYVISPEEFGTEDYDEVDFTYYNDGYVMDDNGEILNEDEIEYYIGKDSLEHFGEYEDDRVFVRNDILKTDFEILMDSRNYLDLDSTDDE